MKLAEGLSIRKDLQTRIEQLKVRLVNNMKVQEGDKPAEKPADLMKELDGCLKELEEMMYRINATNMHTVKDGKTLTQMMAEREVLGKRIQVLREACDRASQAQDRYGRAEIKYVTTIDVPALRKEIDTYSKQLRELDINIQALNFSTELEAIGTARTTGSPGRRR
ncbi:MAG: DIP1984 family protein [Prevotella sp.]|nr:DIP1984 family protein [Prevotella sp.]